MHGKLKLWCTGKLKQDETEASRKTETTYCADFFFPPHHRDRESITFLFQDSMELRTSPKQPLRSEPGERFRPTHPCF